MRISYITLILFVSLPLGCKNSVSSNSQKIDSVWSTFVQKAGLKDLDYMPKDSNLYCIFILNYHSQGQYIFEYDSYFPYWMQLKKNFEAMDDGKDIVKNNMYDMNSLRMILDEDEQKNLHKLLLLKKNQKFTYSICKNNKMSFEDLFSQQFILHIQYKEEVYLSVSDGNTLLDQSLIFFLKRKISQYNNLFQFSRTSKSEFGIYLN